MLLSLFSNPSGHDRARTGRSSPRRRLGFDFLEERTLMAGDPFEVDDTFAQAKAIGTNGIAQTHSIHVQSDVDFVKFTLAATRNVVIETDGVAGGNTTMRLYDAAQRLLPGGFDDNDGNGNYSKLVPADTGALRAGTYYARIDPNGTSQTISSYTIRVRASTNHARTWTGWYFPVQYPVVVGHADAKWPDGNFNFCGSKYFTDKRHIGTDLKATVGELIISIGPGRVVKKWGDGEGNWALGIRHASATGDFLAVYGHLQTSLKENDLVGWAHPLGTIGNYSSGAHFHFGVFPGSGTPVVNGTTRGWGRLTDVGCRNPSDTNGFVAPITWINTRIPVAGS